MHTTLILETPIWLITCYLTVHNSARAKPAKGNEIRILCGI